VLSKAILNTDLQFDDTTGSGARFFLNSVKLSFDLTGEFAMAKQLQRVSKRSRDAAAPVQAQKPEIVFAAQMGRKSVDEIDTDLILLTMLCGMKVPRDLHARDGAVAELIKSAISNEGFEGKRGDKLLIEIPGGKHVLLVGLGRAEKFCGGTAYAVFEEFLQEAIKLGVRRITVPFIPNRGTASCLTMKGMGHKLNAALSKCYKQLQQPVELAQVQIYCTPQAKSHIEKGVQIPLEDGDSCHC
jgi:hypothetical protein